MGGEVRLTLTIDLDEDKVKRIAQHIVEDAYNQGDTHIAMLWDYIVDEAIPDFLTEVVNRLVDQASRSGMSDLWRNISTDAIWREVDKKEIAPRLRAIDEYEERRVR